MNLFSMNY